MSFQEKRAWIALLSTLGVYGVYFAMFGGAWVAGRASGLGFVAPVAGTIVVLTLLQIALLTVAAIMAPSEAKAPLDERDRLVALRSARAGFFAVQASVALALTAVAFGISMALAANLLLGVMVLGEVTRSAWQIAGYRMSAA